MFSPFIRKYIMIRCKSFFSPFVKFSSFLWIYVYFQFNFCPDSMFSMWKLIRLFHFGILSFCLCFFSSSDSVCVPLFICCHCSFLSKKEGFFFSSICFVGRIWGVFLTLPYCYAEESKWFCCLSNLCVNLGKLRLGTSRCFCVVFFLLTFEFWLTKTCQC